MGSYTVHALSSLLGGLAAFRLGSWSSKRPQREALGLHGLVLGHLSSFFLLAIMSPSWCEGPVDPPGHLMNLVTSHHTEDSHPAEFCPNDLPMKWDSRGSHISQTSSEKFLFAVDSDQRRYLQMVKGNPRRACWSGCEDASLRVCKTEKTVSAHESGLPTCPSVTHGC
ncbi:uncharacterized protein LOC110338609 [Mus pahari]|uniref:uncharacterized protein LOC110338609 n=1 Tax=Mus pahari TaxID=10093 RepID=UPI000A310724|nr:uncharacterized protein LOC110338609 [Mus pahari]